MKRFIIAIILLIFAICFAVYADTKTEAIFGNIKAELIKLEKLTYENDLEAVKIKAQEIKDMLSHEKKLLGILSDHNIIKQIEINIQKTIKDNNFDEIKRYCSEAVASCVIIIESFKVYIWNIF